MSDERIAALRGALALSPASHELRRLLAETLASAGDAAGACVEYEQLLAARAVDPAQLLHAGDVAADAGRADLVGLCLDQARAAGVVEGVAQLQRRLDALAKSRGALRLVHSEDIDAAGAAGLGEEPPLTFADIGGLQAVKKTIHRMIVLPFQRPDLYAKYGKRAGGGVLLYGPPGVGKTMLARATAGECGLPFFVVRIEEILDPYFGMSERALVDQAVDHAIDAALTHGVEKPVTAGHLDQALVKARPTTLEWLSSARAYVEFANQKDTYGDIADFLQTKEAKSFKF